MSPSYNSLSLGPTRLEAYAQFAASLDMDAVRSTATALVDLVLTEDTVYMDALPAEVQISTLTELGMLSEALADGAGDPIVIAAISALRGSTHHLLALCPPDMRELIEALPDVPVIP
jgi:hypothetical protein